MARAGFAGRSAVMTPDVWERVGRVLDGALDLPSTERDAFVREACGSDAALRRDVERLLRSSERSEGSVLDRSAVELGAPLLEQPDEVVLGRYELVRRLGTGGMGVVFLARDRELDRPVALKFLAPHVAADADAIRRLRAEARAASALDHPRIAAVYDIGQDEAGRPFIVMGYYEGETLRERIARGPLAVREACILAVDVAEGLVAAHAAGIVHRDIKPSNILLTAGGARILDFGVSKGIDAGLTRQGARPGSVAYMSPEQTRGDAVDQRTDLWSLGVVLYEMLTGVRPFGGDGEEVVIYGVRHDEPSPLESLRPDVPPELVRVVHRCMAKDPAVRHATAEDLLADLRAVTGSSGRSKTHIREQRAAIVVLPFVNISPDPRDVYLSDGLTEEVIADLSHIKALRVISRTSAVRLKGSGKDVRDIARELGVRYVLEGSVRKAGAALRITAQLIDAHTDGHIWARRFDGTVDDVFDVQEQVARATAEALRIQLSPAEVRALSDRPIPDARAYESYLRARYEAWRFSQDGLERAQRYVETALAIVGDNELLYSTLGHVTAMRLEAGFETDAVALERVAELAEKVFALNPDSARGYWLKGWEAYQRGDLRNAIRAHSMAHTLDPGDPDPRLSLGYVYALAGRNADSRRLLERALEFDPLMPFTEGMLGLLAQFEGRFADAVGRWRRQYQMDPDTPFSAWTYGYALAYNRQLDEATAVLDSAADRFPGTALASMTRSLAHALRGETEDTLRAITPAFEAVARRTALFALELAHCYALAGSHETALDWLETSIELGMLNHSFLAEHDSLLDNLRGEPRFSALLEHARATGAELATV